MGVRVRRARAEPWPPRLPRIDRARRTLGWRHVIPAPPRVSHLAGKGCISSRAQKGTKGTKQLLRQKRFKTVELLVAERDWEPLGPRVPHDQIVGLRVAFAEMAIRDRIKQAGGIWNPERRVWQLRYDRVVALGLKSRIVAESASNSGSPRSNTGNLHADA